MPKVGPKSALVGMVNLSPSLRRYLQEKVEMEKQIEAQKAEIAHANKKINELDSQLTKLRQYYVPQIKFFSHILDMTGAPRMLMNIVAETVKENPKLPIEIHSYYPVHEDNLELLRQSGLEPVLHKNHDDDISFVRGDIVFLNTTYLPTSLKTAVYSALEKGIVEKVVWYSHEDTPELFLSEEDRVRIRNFIDSGKITFYSPAAEAAADNKRFLGNQKDIKLQPYKLSFPKKYHRQLKPDDFSKLSFVLTGLASNGNKGQLPILYAFIEFKRRYYDPNPRQYRNFQLTYIGVADTDFMSRQVFNHAKVLGDHFKHSPSVAHDRALEIMLAANVTVCYSVTECRPISVYEGMIMGHPVLRNQVSGLKEQLVDGQNGYLLDSYDFEQVVQVLEKILNIKSTSNQQLAEMSCKSYEIAAAQAEHSYKPIISELVKAYNSPVN